MAERATSPTSPGRGVDAERTQRLRADARRSLSENLAEAIALSHRLHRLAETARRR